MFKKALSSAAVLALAMTAAASAHAVVASTSFNARLQVQPFITLNTASCQLNFGTIASSDLSGLNQNPTTAVAYTANSIAGQSPSLALNDAAPVIGVPTDFTLTGTTPTNVAFYTIAADQGVSSGITWANNAGLFTNSSAQNSAQPFAYNSNNGVLGLQGNLLNPTSLNVDSYSDTVTATLYN